MGAGISPPSIFFGWNATESKGTRYGEDVATRQSLSVYQDYGSVARQRVQETRKPASLVLGLAKRTPLAVEN